MTDEEIKKIAEEYGKNMADNLVYDLSDTPISDYKTDVVCIALAAEAVLKWLSERYSIVKKEKAHEL